MSSSPSISEPSTKRTKVTDPETDGDLSVGRPKYRPDNGEFVTAGGVHVSRTVECVDDIQTHVSDLVNALDSRRGCIFESAYEYPGRYARWTMGFCDPPLSLEARQRNFDIKALNARGKAMLPWFLAELSKDVGEVIETDSLQMDPSGMLLQGVVVTETGKDFTEEERSKQPSVFSIVRRLVAMWGTTTEIDPQLGLYGSFGYDLTFQFEPVDQKQKRDPTQRDLLLYIPDAILVYDKHAREAWQIRYDFSMNGTTTKGLERVGDSVPFKGCTHVQKRRDHEPGEYADHVREAKKQFAVGNLFEVVLSQTFFEPCDSSPSEVFQRLRERNPSPYMFVINLGESEYLVGASPEMFVRTEHTSQGIRVETCPISGTIQRGLDALEDADRIREILVNRKEESELTMCTDVDRNDKSRICRAGSVQVIGRRQIEKYSKLIHTVDHVEGYLRDGFDALDAFLVHTWAVTVTGAPKKWAKQFIEERERSERAWYGGAVGLVSFDGGLNTGLTLRTIRLKDGVAEVRAGATLLFDSVPEDEEVETELKASAFREAVLLPRTAPAPKQLTSAVADGVATVNRRVVLVDHEDSFVQTLANYFREAGADVTTVRWGLTRERLVALKPDLVVLSPGPGNPKDFKTHEMLTMLEELRLPVFGVCLGMQAMVEHFGGELDVLKQPMHGKPTTCVLEDSSVAEQGGEGKGWGVFADLPERFTVGRYHSLYAPLDKFPSKVLVAKMRTVEDVPVVMALEHRTLPMAAVQFHPESILTNPKYGLSIVRGALTKLTYADKKE